MYQLLLVEDENIIRNGLRHIIEKLHLKDVHILEACNGLEAVEIAKKEKPHIIITDIRMPFMDGLELIETLKKLLPNTGFIILSGYSEFEYARTAISLGVTEYLLKPINKEQLTTALYKLLNCIKEKERKQQHLSDTLSGFSTEISRLQKSLLWKIINGKYSPEHILSEISDAKIQFPYNHFLLLSFLGSPEGLAPIEKKLRQYFPVSFYFISDYGYIFYLLNLPTSPYDGLNEFLDYYKNLPVSFPMGISEVAHSPQFLPVLFKQSRSALDNRLFYFDTTCFFYHDFKYTSSDNMFSSQIGEQILLSLNKGNREAAPLIKKFFLKLLEPSKVSAEWIALNIKALSYYLFSTKTIHKETPENSLVLDESIAFFLSASKTFTEFSNIILEQILRLENDASIEDTKNISVTQAMNYVRKYYAKDITLAYISNFVSMNDSYFSSLFKKTTGIGFIKFLQEVRIENAKQLLKDPAIKIYEVSELVGFRDDKYFCKIFKKITGVTPSDYKNFN